MHLARLRLTGFRNLRDTDLEIPPGGVAVVGRNAQGKTNLLEAIYYLETFRSFRGARDDQLVRFGSEVFRLVGHVGSDGVGAVISAAYRAPTSTKKVTVDGEEVGRLGDAIGGLGAVLFTPDDVRLVSDGPGERRRFLDIVLSLNEPDYLAALQRYRQALSQRNAALRDRGGASAVGAWDALLVRAGAEVSWIRGSWIRENLEALGAHYREVSGKASATMDYASSIPGADQGVDVAEVAAAYRQALERSRDAERRRGTTLVGPHRDELRFFVRSENDSRDVREYGSGGQRRTVALALRLLEVDTVRRRRGREPILLLDDVFAELDEERSQRVLALLERLVPGQVILTAPKEADVKFRGSELGRWFMRDGEVTP